MDDLLRVGHHGLGELDVQCPRQPVEVSRSFTPISANEMPFFPHGPCGRTGGCNRQLPLAGSGEDVGEVVHVDAPGGDVGGHQHLEVLLLESEHDPVTLGLDISP